MFNLILNNLKKEFYKDKPHKVVTIIRTKGQHNTRINVTDNKGRNDQYIQNNHFGKWHKLN